MWALCVAFFFFSSRRRHTRSLCDWSSDVCSSDLKEVRTSAQMSVFELASYIRELAQSGFDVVRLTVQFYHKFSYPLMAFVIALIGVPFAFTRSEERRVGKECRSRV